MKLPLLGRTPPSSWNLHGPVKNGYLLGVAAFILGTAPVVDFLAEWFILPTHGVRPATYSVQTERGRTFHTHAGISLTADIYRPVGSTKTPTILVRIPLTRTTLNELRADVIARYWAKRGYTVVIQGTRGRYGSGGEFYPLIHEREDGLETLRWLEKQEWYDGRLAMWGGSSFGHTQWAVADQANPGPGALFIQIASTDFHRMLFPGDAFALESALHWAIRSRGKEDRTVDLKDLEQA